MLPELRAGHRAGIQQPPPGTSFINSAVLYDPVGSWYDKNIERIGDDAERKVANLTVRRIVMLAINDSLKPTGTVNLDEGNTFAQALGKGGEVDQAWKDAKKRYEELGWKNVSIATKLEITYYVQPAPAPGQNRSGKCVVKYRLKIVVSGTNPSNAPATNTYKSIDGWLWFVDDNLKTMTLRNP